MTFATPQPSCWRFFCKWLNWFTPLAVIFLAATAVPLCAEDTEDLEDSGDYVVVADDGSSTNPALQDSSSGQEKEEDETEEGLSEPDPASHSEAEATNDSGTDTDDNAVEPNSGQSAGQATDEDAAASTDQPSEVKPDDSLSVLDDENSEGEEHVSDDSPSESEAEESPKDAGEMGDLITEQSDPLESVHKSAPMEDVAPSDDDGHGEAENADPATSKHKRPKIDPAIFKGVLAGKTTQDELLKHWGSPKQTLQGTSGEKLVYDIKPFKQVVITLIDGKVDTVVITLETSNEPTAMAKQLKIDMIDPAFIYSDQGQLLGQAYPERGVLFAYASNSQPERVAQVVLEPVNSEPFVARAEKNLNQRPAVSLIDANYAVEIDPEFDRAHAVQAKAFAALSELSRAFKAAERAVSLAPDEASHRLVLAQILFQSGDVKASAEEAERAVNYPTAKPIIKAQAYLAWGDAIALSPGRAFEASLKHHQEAIRLAEPIAQKGFGIVRRTAKEVLISAHLAIACDIAWGNWQQKPKVIPKWISRAEALAESLISKDGGDPAIRLQIYERSLAAYAGIKDAPDVAPTIDAMQKLYRKLADKEIIPMRRQMLDWRIGLALADAMLIAQNQKNTDAALQFGEQALDRFQHSTRYAQSIAGANHSLGRVHYRLGAIQAVNVGDHAKAVAYYKKSIPLLEAPNPVSAKTTPEQLGEMFVSMAVSYWETDKRSEALRLTEQGVRMIEQSVASKQLPKSALIVPYGNLASMHEAMGNQDRARDFSRLSVQSSPARRK